MLDRWRKITATRGEINNKLGQIYPNKSGGSLCRPSCPFFLRALGTFGFRFPPASWNLQRAESLSQPLPSRVSYHAFESS